MPFLRRFVAATFLMVLVALVAGCAQRVAEGPGAPQGAQVLLPPPGEVRSENLTKPTTQPAPVNIARRPSAAAPESRPPPPAATTAAPAPPVEAVEEEAKPGTAPPAAPPGITLIPPPGVREAVLVGLLLPLSGSQAEVGSAMLEAAQMALFDLGDAAFTLLPRDTGGTPEGAAKAARSVLDAGAKIILGPLLAGSVMAVAPEARAAGVPVVAFSTDRKVAGGGVFIMGLLPREQVTRVIAFAHDRGYGRFAVLAPDTPFGTEVVGAARKAAAENDAAVTQVEYYDPGGDATAVVRRLANYASRRAALEAQIRDLEARNDEVSRRALARLKSLETLGEVSFDAILLPEGGARLRALAPLLPYYDIDPAKVKLLGTSQWEDPTLGTEPALVGGWFAAPPPAARADFVARYTELHGHPPYRLATLAYDATALAAVLAQGENGPDFSEAALTAEHGYAGVDGIFRFRRDGIVERGLAVLEVRRGGPRVISPAPEVFVKLIY